MNPTETPISFYSFDTPVGHVMVMECRHPDAESDEQPDIALGRMCTLHHRTWYWCLERAEAWCDGGPPEYAYHTGELVPVPEDE